MNQKQHEREAAKFCKPLSAYVHSEYQDGANALCVAGDPVTILRIAERIINRVGEITGRDFELVLKDVSDLHDILTDAEA